MKRLKMKTSMFTPMKMKLLRLLLNREKTLHSLLLQEMVEGKKQIMAFDSEPSKLRVPLFFAGAPRGSTRVILNKA